MECPDYETCLIEKFEWNTLKYPNELLNSGIPILREIFRQEVSNINIIRGKICANSKQEKSVKAYENIIPNLKISTYHLRNEIFSCQKLYTL